ncbi:helix-turn-helix domain-containing protein [Pontibacillus salipaludis]|uniref:HTH araC/xylS-type domain-containing protein n=1 Tax=Pontibacillus salipaludis TaxID=1697394 RepID=A0ABQ1Q391_9BACI|nr:AraC family transcriptional regulator [Pontibacillus salipaludis]GGD11848.1 hypothetical protein GCM10011389_19180 [Pontibacillus salipaludis]
MLIEHKNGVLLKRNERLGERDWRIDPCYKVIFSPLGKGKYQTLIGDISIPKDGFMVFNPNDSHKQLQVTKEKFLIELNTDTIEECQYDLGQNTDIEFARFSYKHPRITQWTTFVRDYIDEANDEKEIKYFLDHSIPQLALLLVKYGNGSHMDEFPSLKSEENLQRVIDALRESYTFDWTLDEMASVYGLNKYQFAHQFKRTTGMAPYSWLQTYRLLRSQTDLMVTTKPVLEIALRHGFHSVSSYNALFRKVYHKTPTMFRRQHKSMK